MKVQTEKLGKNKAQVTVEIPAEEFEPSLEKAYRVVVKKLNVPGFRKGKAPRRIVESLYGKEVLLEDALQDAIPRAYLKALEEIKDEYTAVSEPEYELVTTEIGSPVPVVFKAAFDIKPEVVLGQYKGLELKKDPVEIKAEDVDREIERIRQRYAKLVVAEGPAEMGDTVVIDFTGKIEGETFPGGTGKDYLLELGSNTFIPGFEDQLIGIKTNETKEVNVKFPENYQAQDLAGKEAVFEVTAKEIKRKELAALDDEFAKDVSELATMQELRQDIENKLKETAQQQADNELRNEAIEKAAQNAEIDIPQSMIESRMNTMLEDFAMRIQQQGIPFDYYLQATGKKIEEVRENYRTVAQSSVRADLVLEAIAKQENIKALPEDVDKEIEKIAEQTKQDAAKVREVLEKQGQISSLEFSIMINKAVDFIIAEAKIS